MRSCFFFQAEDGIRDGHVTGVQTCALPITPSTPIIIRLTELRKPNAKMSDTNPGGIALPTAQATSTKTRYAMHRKIAAVPRKSARRSGTFEKSKNARPNSDESCRNP